MAGVVDVLLKIVGDSRDAVRSVNDVGDAAERSTGKVNTLGESFTKWASLAASAAGTFGVVLAGVGEALQQVDQLLGLDRVPNVAGATSGVDTARRIGAAGRFRAMDALRFGLLPELGERFGIHTPWTAEAQERNRVRDAIDQLAASNPEQLTSALPFLTGSQRDLALAALAQYRSAAGYQQALKAQAANITVNTGVGDRNAIGREVRAALDARDRNNGRYVQTNTRR